MIEKVNPSHPDKVADRIAGAIVDLAYNKQDNPQVAVEVLIGHKCCTVIIESSVNFKTKEIQNIIDRIAGEGIKLKLISVPQDKELAANQDKNIKCGDNGIFLGLPLKKEDQILSDIAHNIYEQYPSDGKYLIGADGKLIICQSNMPNNGVDSIVSNFNGETIINPLGFWTGGTDVDSGATNRKLGSDMGHSVTGGGLHGKDFSKADVSCNIYAFCKAQELGVKVEMSCGIGDDTVTMRISILGTWYNTKLIPYSEIVEFAKEYINRVGGFEKFAEWGLF